MPEPIFNALNGGELLDVITQKVRFALEQSGEFKNHRTFPWVKIKVDIGLVMHPEMAIDADPRRVASVEVESGSKIPGAEEEPVELSLVQVIDTPDKARVDAELPIPVQTEVKAGPSSMQVDKPTVAVLPPAKVNMIRPVSAPRVNAPEGAKVTGAAVGTVPPPAPKETK